MHRAPTHSDIEEIKIYYYPENFFGKKFKNKLFLCVINNYNLFGALISHFGWICRELFYVENYF